MAAAQEKDDSGGVGCCFILALIAYVAAVICLCVILGTSKDPVYSVTVTVTGVAGLDDLSASRPAALSPVFNLTVRVDNTSNRHTTACVERLSTVVVSYEDARLARGSVPEFCVGTTEVSERRARAWGQDVALPAFLRDQLAGELAAGEAAVDIMVTTPAEDYRDSDTVLICKQVKIGGGPAPCRKERVYHQPTADI